MQPQLGLGLPFKPMAVGDSLARLAGIARPFPRIYFPGVKTSRDSFLIDVDLDRLKERVGDYFSPDLSHDEIARGYPSVMNPSSRFDANAVRNVLLARGGPNEAGFVHYSYRPFDTRWLYWEEETKLLDEKRANYKPHVFDGELVFGSSTKTAPGMVASAPNK